jgi:2-polyprenyl-3-methyl-5-hydroxy-6-metoxy-1,4-benzoquinol methylase
MKSIENSNRAKEAVQSYFTGTATDYSKLFLRRQSGNNFSFRKRLILAAQMTAGISGRLLDCACGTGEITTAILGSGRFATATIVDLSPRMLELARQRMALDLKAPDFDKLEFKSADIFEFTGQAQIGQFDLILCLGLVAHTGHLENLLARLRSLLTPKGKILLQSSLLDHVGMKIIRALTSGRYYRRHGYRISYFRNQDILQAARSAGLEAVATQRYTFGFPFGDRLCAGVNHLLEEKMQNWARSRGAEALYLLQSERP